MANDPSSRLFDRRKVLIGGSCLLTAGVAAARTPDKPIDLLGKRQIEKLIPQKIGGWEYYTKSGLIVPPADQLRDELYSQLVTRVYLSDDALPIMLLIAQSSGQTGILQVHRPEFCYPAGGFTLLDKAPHNIALPGSVLPSTSFTAVSDDRTEQLLYWTRVGYDMPTTWVQQRWSVARANLLGDIPDAVMVRVSTISGDRERAFATLDTFVRQLFASVPPDVRRILDIGVR